MLSEKEIGRAAQQLAEYRQNNTLSEILERYATLIDDYRRLKSDYEEEREGRERYKQMARSQERNPFVLVLVDGDGYVFNDDLLAAGSEGGSRAAQLLNDTIKASLRRKGLDSCEILVRVYANLVGLSKTLSKANLCGPEKRSLAPFTASFTRSYGLTDFVDAGELKENADFKLRSMLRLFAENAQCKHIYFAACHDVGYVSELTPYRGNRERITLLTTPGLLFHDEFTKLGLGIEELPGVFRTTTLGSTSIYSRTSSSISKSTTMATASSPTIPLQQAGAPLTNEAQKVCQFFPLGKCKYGKGCKNLHITGRLSNSHMNNQASFPFHAARNSRTEEELMNGFSNSAETGGRLRENSALDPTLAIINPFSQLPKKNEIPEGYVALNKAEQRLDPYIPPPSSDAMYRLKDRTMGRKLCNNKHLTGSCVNENCEYDHDPLHEDLKPALEWLSRSLPCAKRDKCRNAACVQGHICQNTDCKHRGGKSFCRIPYMMHLEDLTFDRYVPATVNRPTPFNNQSSPSVSGGEEEEDASSFGAEL
ncbi:hypothetical protein F5B20DRAFT_571542 [Whalleya microplaca]|nr:hypothetical protein F5B20DRAFT_571542 [Whalleya microplaca]